MPKSRKGDVPSSENRDVSTPSDSDRLVTRVQMDLSPRSMERLRYLKETVDATSYAEVIREALKVYEFLIIEDNKKSEFFVRTKDGTTTPIMIFI